MKKLTRVQWARMDAWMRENARPYDRAKWDYLFRGGSKEAIVEQLLLYQNPDGGMGHGLESDLLCPISTAISSAEAIFQAYEYGLDGHADWFRQLLDYLERTVQTIPKYWEDCPPDAMAYPHAPWWQYQPSMTFSPNPCAVVASAFMRYGTDPQRRLGHTIAEDCLRHLVGSGFCGDHDTYNLMVLVEQLRAAESPLVTGAVMAALHRRIVENTCFDPARYGEYVFTPLDFVSSPASLCYADVESGVEQTLTYWLEQINGEGVWTPNFSWGVDSEIARQVTRNWTGYMAVKRARILLNFGRIDL